MYLPAIASAMTSAICNRKPASGDSSCRWRDTLAINSSAAPVSTGAYKFLAESHCRLGHRRSHLPGIILGKQPF